MKVKLLNQTENSIQIEVKETNPVFINTLRRVILNRVPTLAIEDVEIIKNSSAMYNEILAHRLGMIPLTFDFKDNIEKYKVNFVLNKKGPCTVYARDLKSTDKKVFPIDLDIVIVKLLENQEVKIEATAKFGLGKEHSKWIPAKVGYKFYPVLKTAKEFKPTETCVKACPQNILEIKNKRLNLKDPTKCTLCQACVDASSDGGLEVSGDESRIIFTVESVTGQVPREIVLETLKILQKELKELEKKIK